MGSEIHITRGAQFGDAGSRPITAEEWQEVISTTPGVEVTTTAGRFARLDGRPLIFNDGLIAAASAHRDSFETLRAIASSLQARLFAEDGVELGLSAATEVRTTVATAFADLDPGTLPDATAEDLAIVADPTAEAGVRRAAAERTTELQGDPAKIALAYLVCRAVEAGGQPAAVLTSVAAQLLRWDPSRVDGFRRHPTRDWVVELEALSKHTAKSPGLYVIRRCHECGANNRIRLLTEQRPKCGRCKTALVEPEG